ncbi:MAG: hypothetical protein ACHRHE_11750 [Tepidisphaerales bacterium]
MPLQRRHVPGGMVFHVINRGVGRRTIFHKDGPGDDDWRKETVEQTGLQATLRPRGRPANTARQEAN